jgi:hypothetical protein
MACNILLFSTSSCSSLTILPFTFSFSAEILVCLPSDPGAAKKRLAPHTDFALTSSSHSIQKSHPVFLISSKSLLLRLLASSWLGCAGWCLHPYAFSPARLARDLAVSRSLLHQRLEGGGGLRLGTIFADSLAHVLKRFVESFFVIYSTGFWYCLYSSARKSSHSTAL